VDYHSWAGNNLESKSRDFGGSVAVRDISLAIARPFSKPLKRVWGPGRTKLVLTSQIQAAVN